MPLIKKEVSKKDAASAKQGGKEVKISLFQAPKGMHDILPTEWVLRDKLYKAAKEL